MTAAQLPSEFTLQNPELVAFWSSGNVCQDESDLAIYRLTKVGSTVGGLCLAEKSRYTDVPEQVLDPERIEAVAFPLEGGGREVLEVDVFERPNLAPSRIFVAFAVKAARSLARDPAHTELEFHVPEGRSLSADMMGKMAARGLPVAA